VDQHALNSTFGVISPAVKAVKQTPRTNRGQDRARRELAQVTVATTRLDGRARTGDRGQDPAPSSSGQDPIEAPHVARHPILGVGLTR
jgi:hypothetical protein